MATFTIRIPDDMAGRLSSSDMRSWLAQFLRNPSFLPADPGCGSERISLTLPKELVHDAAGYLRCSPSIALRRLAAAHLNVQAAPKPAAPHRPSRSIPIAAPRPATSPRHTSPGTYPTGSEHDNSAAKAAAQEMAGWIWIAISIGAAIIGALLFFGTGQIGVPESA